MRNFTIGRVWGIPIRINISLVVFLPILAWLIGTGTQIAVYAGLIEAIAPVTIDPATLAAESRWVIGILAAVGLFVSVAIHELGHAWAAMRYGVEVQSITLWILGGLASLSSVPREWDREFWIAVAGPAASVLVGAVCLAALYVIPASAPVAVFVVGWLAVTNIVLTVFNMLPAFPMDGGRVLRALLARSRPYGSATRIAARIGTGFAVLFAIVGVLAFSPLLLLLALFIYGAASGESRVVMLGDLLEGLTVGDLATAENAITRGTAVDGVLPRLLGARRSELPVVDDSGAVVGAVTASALRDVDPDDYQTTTVESLLSTDLPRLDAEMTAFDGLIELDSTRASVALVERDGSVVGIISRSDYSATLALRQGKEPF